MTSTIAPVHKQVTVPCSAERAFQAFTAEIGQWWPLETHGVGGDDATGVSLEGRVGGLIREHLRDGSAAVWGTVTAWEPPNRVAFTWHPGRDPEHPTYVEVRFIEEGGNTRVELEHTAWEQWDDAETARASYDNGWNPVLARLSGFLS